MTEVTQKANEIAARISSHAYMSYAYSEGSYRRVARFLMGEGFTPVETEYIMDSKHMRWAYDMSDGGGKATSETFKKYYVESGAFIRRMVEEHGAELQDYGIYIGKQIERGGTHDEPAHTP